MVLLGQGAVRHCCRWEISFCSAISMVSSKSDKKGCVRLDLWPDILCKRPWEGLFQTVSQRGTAVAAAAAIRFSRTDILPRRGSIGCS